MKVMDCWAQPGLLDPLSCSNHIEHVAGLGPPATNPVVGAWRGAMGPMDAGTVRGFKVQEPACHLGPGSGRE